MRAAIYNKSTGVIVMVVDMPESFIERQIREGQDFAEVSGDVGDATHVIVDGAPQALPPPQPPSLSELRAVAHAAIERWRDEQEAASILFEYAGHTWDGGLVTRQRLQPVLSLAELPEGFIWTDAGNVDVPMDLAGLAALNAAHELALVAQGFRIHLRQRQLKGDLETMAREQLEAFVPGWP